MKRVKIFALIEVLLMLSIIILDVLIPSILIVIIGVVFIRINKERLTFFENKVWTKPVRFILICFGLGVTLTLFDYCILIPILNHVTNTTQNMNVFAKLKGNEVLLAVLLAYSWGIAAIVEEFAYRGFFQNRIISLFSNRMIGIVVAVIGTSILFGVMHREQGVVGICNTAFDAVVLSVIRYRFKNIWGSVLVHGASNTIGLVAFYLVGPINGLW